METKKMNLGMLVGLVLIANFALAAFASLEKDVITADAIRALTKSSNKFPVDAINALVKSKTLVSKIELEEAFQLQDANGVTAFGIPCGESCVWIPCVTGIIGCRCSSKVCYRGF